MRILIAGRRLRWVALIGILALMAAVVLPVTASSSTRVEVEVEAENAAGDELDVEVSGPKFNSLTGTAVLEKADGTVVSLLIDTSAFFASVGTGFQLTLLDFEGTTTACGAVAIILETPGGGPPAIRVREFTAPACVPPGAVVATFFSSAADELDIEIEFD